MDHRLAISRLATVVFFLQVGTIGCQNETSAPEKTPPPPPAPEKAASSASQPGGPASASSMPADHSTSSTAINLETLFKVPEVDGDTVMTVGTAKVTKADLESALRGLQVEVTAAGVPDNLSRYEVLQSAADRVNEVALRSLLATELKVKVDPKEVDAWVKDLELRMEENPSFKAFLLRAGKDKKARRIDGERAIQWKRIQDTVFDQVLEESEDLARSHYDKNRHQYIEREGVETWRIVMKAPRGMVQRDRDAAESRAKKIHERAVKDPSSFEILAQMHSQGGKGRHGGFIGWVPRNTLNKDLEEMIYSAKPGTILPLQEAPTGYTIYKVGRHRDERVKPFDSVKGDILRKVFPARINKKVAAHLERLRAKYPAKTNIPELAVLAKKEKARVDAVKAKLRAMEERKK